MQLETTLGLDNDLESLAHPETGLGSAAPGTDSAQLTCSQPPALPESA